MNPFIFQIEVLHKCFVDYSKLVMKTQNTLCALESITVVQASTQHFPTPSVIKKIASKVYVVYFVDFIVGNLKQHQNF